VDEPKLSCCTMPCKWYLIRLPKNRFGPCISGSVRTFLVCHRRQVPSGMGATRLPPLFPLFAVLLRTALRFCNSAGEKMLCWAWHRAHCRYGYKSSTSVWGDRHGSGAINHTWMHRRIRPHSPLHTNAHSTTSNNSRGFVYVWF